MFVSPQRSMSTLRKLDVCSVFRCHVSFGRKHDGEEEERTSSNNVSPCLLSLFESAGKASPRSSSFFSRRAKALSMYISRDLEHDRGVWWVGPSTRRHAHRIRAINRITLWRRVDPTQYSLARVFEAILRSHGETSNITVNSRCSRPSSSLLCFMFLYNLGISSASLCTACWPGYYSESLGASGHATCIECPSNHSQPIFGAASQWDCVACSDGQVCTRSSETNENYVDYTEVGFDTAALKYGRQFQAMCGGLVASFQSDGRRAGGKKRGGGGRGRGRAGYSLII